MALDNPAFRNQAFQRGGAVTTAAPTAASLQEMYARPSAGPVETDRMTVEDTIMKTAISFGVLLVGAAAAWFLTGTNPGLAMPLIIVGALVGFVLALVNIFKREPSPGLILAYAAAEGVFVGAMSALFEQIYSGVVIQAVLATLVVVGVTLALFASGKIRASRKATKVFLIAMVGYLVFSLVNMGLMLFGATDNPWGLRGVEFYGIPLGLLLGVLVVIMAAYSLVLDFDSIQRGVRNGAPRKYGWSGAFGIMVTVVWLYIELLRMFAIARGD